MNETQTLIAVLAFAAIGTVILFKRNNSIPVPLVIDESETEETAMVPGYLGYNYPWGFSTPVQPALPPTTLGQIGQTYGKPCGC